MNSVLIRDRQDLQKITSSTKEIEFISYNDDYCFCSKLDLLSITFTKMTVYLDNLPKNIKSLGLYDCWFYDNLLEEFKNLECLEITNSSIDINKIVVLDKLKSINISFCKVIDSVKLGQFRLLEEIILDDTDVDNLDFLLNIDTLKKVIINDDMIDKFNLVFMELMNRGVIICNVMGGVFNEV